MVNGCAFLSFISSVVATVNQLIFEGEKVSKVLEKPFRKLFNFEKSRGVCTGL